MCSRGRNRGKTGYHTKEVGIVLGLRSKVRGSERIATGTSGLPQTRFKWLLELKCWNGFIRV